MSATKRNLSTLPILIFVMGVCLSVWLLQWLVDLQHDRIRRDFGRLAGDRSAAVAERIQNNFAIPLNIRQLYEASSFVEEESFSTYVAPLLQRFPELKSAAWAKRVTAPGGENQYPILYLESQANAGLAKGLDLNSLPELAKAISVSVRNNQPESIHLALKSATGTAPSDWLIAESVASHHVQSEGETDDGILLARIDLYRLMYEAFDSLEKIGLDATIYDGVVADDRVLVRWLSLTRSEPYDPAGEMNTERYAYSHTVKIGMKDWIIRCRPAPFFLSHYRWWEQGFVFAGCVLMSALVAIYLLRQRLAERDWRRQNEIIRLLETVAVAANEAEDDEVLLQHSLELICEFLNCPFGDAYLITEAEPDHLVSSGIFYAAPALDPIMQEASKDLRFTISDEIPGRIWAAGEPVFISDVLSVANLRRKEALQQAGLRSCYAFPVIVRKKVAAVVEFYYSESVAEPFEGWKTLLLSISTQMAHSMERSLAAGELQEKNAVMENAAEGIARVDATGIYLSANKAYARMCGIPVEEIIGKNGREWVHPDDVEIYKAAYTRMIETGRAEVKGRRLRPDQSVYFQDLTLIRDTERAGTRRGCYLFSRDVTQRELQQKALRASEERFLAFMANSPASAAIKDENSLLIYMNQACSDQFGFDLKKVIGMTPEELVGPEAAVIVRASDQELLASGKAVNLIETLPNKAGEMRHWMVCKFPMKGVEGRTLIGALCLDITERMMAEKAIITARDEALQSVKMKSQFLANMSHEIRTPMNGLIGMLGLLAGTELQPRQIDLLRTASHASESLLRLLNDILDFSKIDAGKLEIDPIIFDPRQCVRHAAKILAEPARKKGLALAWTVADDVPNQLFGDSGRLSQIIVNLLNNGIKFTRQGSVSVHLEVDRWLEDPELMLHCVIRDTGIGVSESHRAIIFEPFRQSDSSTARQYGGTGLGLAICSQLAGLMGGSIWVESEPGGGSAFHFTVQMDETGEPVSSLLIDRPLLPKAGQSLRILLAEDNEINQKLAITLLEERGHQIVVARDGYEAVRHFQNADFDLILMDVQMPGKDGYEATEDIRKDPRGKTIPIYAVTAHAMPEDRRRCLAAGMNDYLIKPIRVDEFARLVEAKVERAQSSPMRKQTVGGVKTRRIDWQPSLKKPSQRPGPEPRSFDLQALRQVTNQNDRLLCELARSFATQGNEDHERIRISIQEKDAGVLEHSAHRLKGSALSLAAVKLPEIVQGLESAGRTADFEQAGLIWPDFDVAFQQLLTDLATIKI